MQQYGPFLQQHPEAVHVNLCIQTEWLCLEESSSLEVWKLSHNNLGTKEQLIEIQNQLHKKFDMKHNAIRSCSCKSVFNNQK